jgi:hypothetical protein
MSRTKTEAIFEGAWVATKILEEMTRGPPKQLSSINAARRTVEYNE